MEDRRTGTSPSDLAAILDERLRGSALAVSALVARREEIEAFAVEVIQPLRSGGRLLTAGNGGSAAQALHLAEELIGRYRADRAPQSAVRLCADSPALTCIANDYGFEQIFARQVEALARPGDALLVLSTSGRSKNLVRALEQAAARDCRRLGLLGDDGGTCAELCDRSFIIPGADSAHVQEAHQVIIHLICEIVDLVARR